MNYTLQINRFESNNKLINYAFNLPEAEINAKIEEYKTPGFIKLLMRVLDNNSKIIKSIELNESTKTAPINNKTEKINYGNSSTKKTSNEK
jgi:hypothetical protein